MKLTKRQLKEIIKEECLLLLKEATPDDDEDLVAIVSSAQDALINLAGPTDEIRASGRLDSLVRGLDNVKAALESRAPEGIPGEALKQQHRRSGRMHDDRVDAIARKQVGLPQRAPPPAE